MSENDADADAARSRPALSRPWGNLPEEDGPRANDVEEIEAWARALMICVKKNNFRDRGETNSLENTVG